MHNNYETCPSFDYVNFDYIETPVNFACEKRIPMDTAYRQFRTYSVTMQILLGFCRQSAGIEYQQILLNFQQQFADIVICDLISYMTYRQTIARNGTKSIDSDFSRGAKSTPRYSKRMTKPLQIKQNTLHMRNIYRTHYTFQLSDALTVVIVARSFK